MENSLARYARSVPRMLHAPHVPVSEREARAGVPCVRIHTPLRGKHAAPVLRIDLRKLCQIFIDVLGSIFLRVKELTGPLCTTQEPFKRLLPTLYIIRVDCTPLWGHVKQCWFSHTFLVFS